MLDLLPTLDELISLYTYEPSLIDFYVEGPNDKIVYENYIRSRNIKIKIVEIDIIDIKKDDNIDSDLDLYSNKGKLIFLSRVFVENHINATVLCLVDKDLDEALNELENNIHLMYYDYNCLESYFFSEIFIDKFISIAIRNFPYSVNKVMHEVGKVVRGIFIIRLIRYRFARYSPLLKIDNNISINRGNGNISFDPIDYLNKFIQINKLSNNKKNILDMYSYYDDLLDADVRYTFNGHDFIKIFFLYINKIKNTINFNEDNFERTIYTCIQPDYFDEYPLFYMMRNA